MSLSKSENRKLSHTRTVTCKGYERTDGLWDIEGHMTDIKPFTFQNKDRGGEIKAGEPLHEMWVRLTINTDYEILNAEAVIEWAPFNYCSEIEGVYKKLIGLTIGPGWNRKAKELMAGTKGCTHLTELLGPMATTAYQTLFADKSKQHSSKPNSSKPRPGFLNSCHSLSESGPVVLEHWPEYHTKDADKSS